MAETQETGRLEPEPLEYVCEECGRTVTVQPYTDEEAELLADWSDEFHGGEGQACSRCAQRLREEMEALDA